LGAEAAKKQKADERKYEANKGEDIIDHLSKDWKLIGMSEDVRVYEGRKAMAADIMRPTRTRKPIESPVGHISLDFHPDDAPAMTDKRMAEIAFDYMKQMGLVDTPFIVVRHYDKAHPHCHLVFSRINNKGKILSQTTNFNRNGRVCKKITEKYGLTMGKTKLTTDVSKLRGKEKMPYQVTQDISRCFPVATDWNSFEAELKKYGITTKEKISEKGNVNLYYCKGKFEFWSQKLHKNFARYPLECYFTVKRQKLEAQKASQNANEERPKVTQRPVAVSTTPKAETTTHRPQAAPKPYVIPPLPFEFLWDVPLTDEAAYRRGETVYTFARKPGDMYKAHYWIWHDFKTGKPQFSFDPPKNRDIPPAFLQQVVSSSEKALQSQSSAQSSGLGLFNPSSGSAPNDEVCIANGQPVSGDFKRFLEDHPDMDFYEAKRKFKEEQKAKQNLRQGPKLH
ncbi:MAG: relaxase/mobilization nuclease domain-containing protein, partial [Muribaculum sp.]|nr:relaxase/mobilization nuclease domain-containing protein [Muribaculum sp.]